MQSDFRSKSEAEASKCLDFIGIRDLPVSLTNLCAKLDIKIQYGDFEVLDGFLLRQPSVRALIAVNDRWSRERQRFSVAHEIGHLKLGHGFLKFSGGSIYRKKWEEVEANCFAHRYYMRFIIWREFDILQRLKPLAFLLLSRKGASIMDKKIELFGVEFK